VEAIDFLTGEGTYTPTTPTPKQNFPKLLSPLHLFPFLVESMHFKGEGSLHKSLTLLSPFEPTAFTPEIC
jgi:hypothetical protein